MTRFRTLLAPGQGATPKEDQDHASRGLADAVSQSHLHWWKKRDANVNQGSYLLLAVAPYSQYDLALLDVIDERLGSNPSPSARIYVVNLMDYENEERLESDFPGIGRVHQTPIATLWESGKPKKSACGKQARDLAAEALGVSGDYLYQRIVAESPRLRGSANR
jgi:hypothetical protein